MPDETIKIGLLLALTGPWKAGRTIPGAAALAVQRINADPSFLGGMRIEYVYVDAGFTVSSGSDAMSKLLAMKGIDAVFGPGEPTFFGFVSLRLPPPLSAGLLTCIGWFAAQDAACQSTVRHNTSSRHRRGGTTVWWYAGAGDRGAKLVSADLRVHGAAAVGHWNVPYGTWRFASASVRCPTQTDLTGVRWSRCACRAMCSAVCAGHLTLDVVRACRRGFYVELWLETSVHTRLQVA